MLETTALLVDREFYQLSQEPLPLDNDIYHKTERVATSKMREKFSIN